MQGASNLSSNTVSDIEVVEPVESNPKYQDELFLRYQKIQIIESSLPDINVHRVSFTNSVGITTKVSQYFDDKRHVEATDNTCAKGKGNST
jgi:hypothetical protein